MNRKEFKFLQMNKNKNVNICCIFIYLFINICYKINALIIFVNNYD